MAILPTAPKIADRWNFPGLQYLFMSFADNVEDILLSANHVQMLPVIAACSDFLKSHLSLDNCIDMLNMAELFSMKNLKQIVLRFMCSNLTKLAGCANFYHKIPLKQLLLLLTCDCPVDCCEAEVLSTTLNWMAYQYDQRVQYASSLLSQVHLRKISPEELVSLPNRSVLEKVLDVNPSIQRMMKFHHEKFREATPTDSGLTNDRGFYKALGKYWAMIGFYEDFKNVATFHILIVWKWLLKSWAKCSVKNILLDILILSLKLDHFEKSFTCSKILLK